MAVPAEDGKKLIETVYLDEAQQASSIFPSGELAPHERPDFLLRIAERTIGIEVTELCREGLRAGNWIKPGRL